MEKERYTSIGGGEIALGHFKNRSSSSQLFNSGLISHYEGNRASVESLMNSSSLADLSGGSVKFGKGFYRRQENSIFNETSNERKQYSSQVAEKSLKLSEARSNRLQRIESRCNYDLINFSDKPQCGSEAISREGKRQLGGGIIPETLKRGQNVLRDSNGRFFSPQPSGTRHEYRQNVLLKEGVFTPRTCSIIQLGKKDIPSSGVEDQFSKSQYLKTSAITQHGLAEYRVPGAYTPRKQFGHPSANPKIVQHWNHGVDINNSTLRGVNQYP